MKDEDFFKNWTQLKPIVLLRWFRIEKKAVEGIPHTIDALVKAIKGTYKDLSEESIIAELESFHEEAVNKLKPDID